MPHQLWFTAFLNQYLAGPVSAMMSVLHVPNPHPRAPISNYVAMEILVFLLLVLFFIATRISLSWDKPGVLQHIAEGMNNFVSNQGEEMIGHGYETYTSYIVTLGVFILSMNLIGLIPGFEAPTAFPSVPLGCALVTWFFYHVHGLRENGVIGYLKHFLGPVWWISPLLFVIEICSHFARIMSLTIRLYANMFAGDMVTLAFFSLVPLGFPVVFMGLHIFVSLIQTYIFITLAAVYLAEATAHGHD
ncbi:ATP synthase F0 subcomplex A subunit [Candidatus Koribacter versatilis Ellin345]|uniref:ATP synthase subunit a n=1 Tax=Koribacter versatilis (strain Ellin345) TaxID=204669 RepID=ATP6_KORVE|nr:F0F1 ATP synthase subunit A [Candidatus Koribacter versatilis]Q1IS49.1 RecName: Full=ATP synthase subunit a; AltName: Full=ATP synthase F0 sector subunit a; AltName: Full=F-ATPase subunit 6 [Candidatus Koribacter versatilis Ellin345]ABF40301.1 ATP synthase F0 subcomplex A subunit [Candidatus Koribacter versatilis Ellin345]